MKSTCLCLILHQTIDQPPLKRASSSSSSSHPQPPPLPIEASVVANVSNISSSNNNEQHAAAASLHAFSSAANYLQQQQASLPFGSTSPSSPRVAPVVVSAPAQLLVGPASAATYVPLPTTSAVPVPASLPPLLNVWPQTQPQQPQQQQQFVIPQLPSMSAAYVWDPRCFVSVSLRFHSSSSPFFVLHIGYYYFFIVFRNSFN